MALRGQRKSSPFGGIILRIALGAIGGAGIPLPVDQRHRFLLCGLDSGLPILLKAHLFPLFLLRHNPRRSSSPLLPFRCLAASPRREPEASHGPRARAPTRGSQKGLPPQRGPRFPLVP